MPAIELRTSRARALRLVLLSLVMVAGSLFVALVVPDGELHGPLLAAGPTGIRVVGWTGVAFFGFAVYRAVALVFDRAPRIRIAPDGLWARDLRLGTIPWDDVLDARLVKVSGTELVTLTLAERHVSGLGKAARAIAAANQGIVGAPFALGAAGLEVDARALLGLVERARAEHARPSGRAAAIG
jgi:hypothetical protein